MYNIKYSGKDTRINRESEPLDSGLLRVWIMLGGMTAFLALVIDRAVFATPIRDAFILLMITGFIAYLFDLYSEQFRLVQKMFLGLFLSITFLASVWSIVVHSLSSIAFALYSAVILALIYKEYFRRV